MELKNLTLRTRVAQPKLMARISFSTLLQIASASGVSAISNRARGNFASERAIVGLRAATATQEGAGH